MRVIVSQLTSKGHHIEYYVRKDGGILIRSIDGERFKEAKGNARARQMAGVQLSEARITQLKYATGTRKELRTPSLRRTQVKDAIWEEYARVKKMWNKAFKSKNGKSHPAGYFGKARIKKSIRDWGEEEALRRIGEAEKYASGIAYSKNVQILAEQIKKAGYDYDSQELINLADDILNNAYAIREEWIQPAYNQLYKLNDGVDPKEVAKNVRKVLRLDK